MAATDVGPAWDSFGHTGWDLIFQNWAMGSDPKGRPGPARVCGGSLWGRARLPRTEPLARLGLSADQYQVVPLRFSQELDAQNPNTPEWREDVGLVVTRLLSKVLPQHPRAPQRSWGVGRGGVGTAARSHSDLASGGCWVLRSQLGSPAWVGRGLRLSVTSQGRHRSCESQLLTQEQPLLSRRPGSL